jgi:hypothetical protein
MFRSVGAAAILVITSMAALGCGSGLSDADAAIRCDQEKTSKGMLFGPTTYQECLNCYETCGDTCAAISTSPPTYQCTDPGDQILLAAKNSSGGTSSSTGQ